MGGWEYSYLKKISLKPRPRPQKCGRGNIRGGRRKKIRGRKRNLPKGHTFEDNNHGKAKGKDEKP